MDTKKLQDKIEAVVGEVWSMRMIELIINYYPKWRSRSEGDAVMLMMQMVQEFEDKFWRHIVKDVLPAAITEAEKSGIGFSYKEDFWTRYVVVDGLCFDSQYKHPNEIYEQLRDALEKEQLLPDEYFVPGHNYRYEDSQIPKFSRAIAYAVVGGSEGHYIRVDLLGVSELATTLILGKTLQEGKAGMQFACRIAGRITELVNGYN